jgi:D-3-phosphoglycerate dehydrogenase
VQYTKTYNFDILVWTTKETCTNYNLLSTIQADNMASARDIPQAAARTVSYSNVSVSPTATAQSPPSSFPHASLASRTMEKQLKPFNKPDIKILLLENVNQSGRDLLTAQGYQVEALKTSLPEAELIEKIR